VQNTLQVHLAGEEDLSGTPVKWVNCSSKGGRHTLRYAFTDRDNSKSTLFAFGLAVHQCLIAHCNKCHTVMSVTPHCYNLWPCKCRWRRKPWRHNRPWGEGAVYQDAWNHQSIQPGWGVPVWLIHTHALSSHLFWCMTLIALQPSWLIKTWAKKSERNCSALWTCTCVLVL